MMRLDEGKLRRYLDGELSEPERAQIEAELAHSPKAQTTLAELRQVKKTVGQALDSLAPASSTASPAASAFKRLKAHLIPAGPSPAGTNETSPDGASPAVWESPTLLADIRSGLKTMRSGQTDEPPELQRRSKIALAALAGVIGLIALVLALWLLPDLAGQIWQVTQPLAAPFAGVSEPDSQAVGAPGQVDVTVLVTSSPPPTGTLAIHGIQVDPLGDTAANLDYLQALGFGWIKFRMPWKEVEPEQHQYEWESWDGLIDAYAANGNKVMLNIVHAPDWARPDDDDRSVEGLPADPATYADFVAQVAHRYQGRVQAIEVWNEQNLWYKVGGRGRMDAAAYVQLLQAAYKAIKAANPDMIVISGGLSPAGNVGDLATDDIDYLIQMYANGFKDSVDGVGASPYGFNCPALADWRTVTPEEASADSSQGLFTNRHHSWCFLGTLEGYREVMLTNDDGDTPIWVTQFGWAVSDSAQPGYEFARDNTPEEQARWIVEAYQWADAQEWVGSMFLFNLDYGLTAADTELAYYSILDRPAYDALVALDEGGAETALDELAASATAEPAATPIPISPPLEPGTVRLSARHGIQADPLGDAEANIGHLQTLGFGWVKFQMAWKDVEPEQDQYQWERWDEVIQAYADSGIKVMLSIPKAPDWARPADDDKSVEGPPVNPATYADFVALVAGRYRGQVQAIEIWNEQNLWYEAGGQGRINAANYVDLLKQAYTAIKTANPDLIVISGALAPASNVDDLAVDDIEYLKQMYANGARGFFDVLGAHPSGYNCPALADWRTVTPDEASADPTRGLFTHRYHSWCFLGTMEGYREVMVTNGDGNKAIWPTEFGWAVADQPQAGYEFAQDNTVQEQAQWTVEAYQWAEAQPWVGPMFLWNLDYGLTASGTELAYFGIIGKPVYYALANQHALRRNADFEIKNVRQLTPCENQGRNHIFIKVQDPLGNGLNGVPIRIEWGAAPDEFRVAETGTKTNLEGNPEPGLVEVAMAAGAYSVQIEGSTSEVAAGLTADYGVEEPCGSEAGNSLHHVSFEVVFERVH
jgi:anti-sigma factor RsiW/3',5'-cyclic AMP phosphodiesterase CpdA